MSKNKRLAGEEAMNILCRLDSEDVVCTACDDSGWVMFPVVVGQVRENIEQRGGPYQDGGEPGRLPDTWDPEMAGHPCRWCEYGMKERREHGNKWRIR